MDVFVDEGKLSVMSPELSNKHKSCCAVNTQRRENKQPLNVILFFLFEIGGLQFRVKTNRAS